MTKTILIAVDLTAPASWQTALPEAVRLAQERGAALYVLYVLPDYGTALVAGFFPDEFAHKATEKAQAELKALVAREVPPELGAKALLRHGTMHEEVLAAISEIGADLVVMASHAPERIREFLVGSNADRVVRRSPVSVLVVRG